MPKVGIIARPKLHVATGAVVVRVPTFFETTYSLFGLDKPRAFTTGFVYGAATYGTNEHSLTGDVAVGLNRGQLTSDAAVMLGGRTRISSELALISENWIGASSDGSIMSLGLRLFDRRASLDAALVLLPDYANRSSVLFPFVAFALNF